MGEIMRPMVFWKLFSTQFHVFSVEIGEFGQCEHDQTIGSGDWTMSHLDSPRQRG